MADFSIKAIFSVEGLENIQAAFKDISEAASRVGEDFGNLKDSIGESVLKFTELGTAVIGVVGGFIALADANATMIKGVENLSQETGISTQKLQELEFQGERIGITSIQMESGLTKFSIGLAKARDGTGVLQTSLAKLDPALLAQLKSTNDTGKAFDLLIKAMGGINDVALQNAIAVAAFGRGGVALAQYAREGAKEIAGFNQVATDLGIVLTDQDVKASDKLFSSIETSKGAVKGLGLAITTALTPALIQASDAFTHFVVENRPLIATFVQQVIGALIPGVVHFFEILTGGSENDRIRAIADLATAFNKVKIAVEEAWTIAYDGAKVAIAIFGVFYTAIDQVAKALGLGNGMTFIILYLTGVLKVFFNTAKLAFDAFGLFVDIVRAGPTAFLLLGEAITGGGAAIVTTINAIKLSWTLGMLLMEESVTHFLVLLPEIGTIATAALAAIISPTGLVIAGLVALGVALGVAIHYWPELKQAAENALNWIQNKTVAAGQAVRQFFVDVKNDLVAVYQWMVTGAENAFNSVVGAIENAFTSVINSIKSIFGPIFDWITGAVHSLGGVVSKTADAIDSAISSGPDNPGYSKGYSDYGPPQGFASGGLIRGHGTGTSDSNLIKGSSGEYVVRASSVAAFGTRFMDHINNGVIPAIKGFAAGGLIGGGSGMSGTFGMAPAHAASGRPLHLHLGNGNVVTAHVDESTAKKLERDLSHSNLAKSAPLPRWYK